MFYLVFFCVIMILIILCRSFYEITHFVVKRYEFENRNVLGAVKILYVSDLHESCFGEENERLVQVVLSEKPDCIII